MRRARAKAKYRWRALTLAAAPIWVALLAASRAGAAPCEDPFDDDYSDTAAGATVIGEGGVSGSIEIDIDCDWFRFTARQDKEYVVTVTPGTLWDADLSLSWLSGSQLLASTSSVGAAQAEITWVNPAPAVDLYVEVGGYAMFTTGTYSVVVSEQAVTDADPGGPDGLPDVWEQGYFGSLVYGPGDDPDGDGLSNLDEYKLGTDPTDAASALKITDLHPASPEKEVQWNSAPLRVYDVLAAPSLIEPDWVPIGTVTGVSSVATFIDPEVSGHNMRFYQIKLTE